MWSPELSKDILNAGMVGQMDGQRLDGRTDGQVNVWVDE